MMSNSRGLKIADRGTAAAKRAFLFLSLLTVFSASYPVDHAFARSADEAVRAVEKHYRDVSTLRAKVTQKNYLQSLDKTQTFEGTLWIRKPGKLRLEYTNGQLILIEGTTVLFYSEKSEQVIKKTFTDFEDMNIPVAFLLGAGSIREDFEAFQPDPGNAGILSLVPKKPGAAMKKLVLKTNSTGRISELTIYDKSGNITTIQFSGVDEGIDIGRRLFTFKPPGGTEIIEQ